MNHARPLPSYLVQRYHGWKATTWEENRAWYRRLAQGGQHPRAMIISCCDSRVHVTSIFGADQGEFFIHRNIANLVPPHNPDGEHHGTSAALEYGVTALQVAHLIVIGHSGCGGVKGCHDMCSGHAPALEDKGSYVGRWMDILRPGYERIKELVETASAFGSAGAFVVAMFAFFSRFGGPQAAIASLLAGILVWAWGRWLWALPYPYLTAVAAALTAYVAVGLVERQDHLRELAKEG